MGSIPEQHHHHMRTTSLPTLSHPAVSALSLSLHSLRATSSSSSHRLQTLHDLLSSLSDLLRLPCTRTLLRLRRPLLLSLLDRTLLLADAYDSLRHHLLALRQLLAESQVALRLRDPRAFSSAARARRALGKDLARLASSMGSNGGRRGEREEETAGEQQVVVGLLGEAGAALPAASRELFLGLVGLSSTGTHGSSPVSSAWAALQRRRWKVQGKLEEDGECDWEKRMEGLRRAEECVGEVETGCELVFSELVGTRVLLLNILTDAMN